MLSVMISYLRPKELLFLSPWRPVATDTSAYEGQPWECPACMEPRAYFRSLARLEGDPFQFMVQCPTCDHLAVVQADVAAGTLAATHLGPHVEAFIRYLNEANARRDAVDELE